MLCDDMQADGYQQLATDISIEFKRFSATNSKSALGTLY